jgi:poly-gamma-glutamate synthesis protein (capsule biosynthesis protein)
LAVPAQWRAVVENALLSSPDLARWGWRLAPPHAAADLRLAASDAGIPVMTRPLALAVPFTDPREAATPAEAEAILAGQDETVAILPWAEMTATHKALRIDGRSPADPDYPLQERWSLVGAPEAAARALAPVLAAALAPETAVHLAAVGDLMLDRALGYALRRGDTAYPFAPVAETLAAADLTVGNLECALGDVGTPAAKSYTFQAPPAAAPALALAGFDVLTLANNHAADYGTASLRQGIDLLRQAGVATVGAGANETAAHAPYIAEVKGLRLAFLGYVHVPVEVSGFDTATWTAQGNTPGLAWGDPARIRADVAAAAPQVDHVIVLLHSGYEYVDAPSPPQIAAARAAIDAGATLVIGHHAHVLQGIEFYRDGVIAYGLGNFAFEIDGPPETAIFHAWLDGDGVREIRLQAAVVQFGGQPRLAEPWEAGPILRRVYYLSDLLNEENR